MNRTSLVMRGIVAFAVFAMVNAATAQTFPGPGWIFPVPPALQWTPVFPSAASPLRNYSSPRVPAFQLGARGEDRPELLPANQQRGVCRRRGAARGLELQRNGF